MERVHRIMRREFERPLHQLGTEYRVTCACGWTEKARSLMLLDIEFEKHQSSER